GAPRADPKRAFAGLTRAGSGDTKRIRSESFADHYSQARMFFLSQTEAEKTHIVSALVFELSKIETPTIRERVVAHLVHVDESMSNRVAAGLRLAGAVKPAATQVPARREIKASPALSMIGKARQTLKGRVVGLLVSDLSIVLLSKPCARRSKKREPGSRSSRRRSAAPRLPMGKCSRLTCSSLAHHRSFSTPWRLLCQKRASRNSYAKPPHSTSYRTRLTTSR